MMAVTVREDVAARIDAARDELFELSRRLHAHPEISGEERQASAWLAEALERHGFRVERGVAGLETAFVATAGEGSPILGIVAEYDALPGIGHACGHNLIATSALGAAIGARDAVLAAGGTLKVFGTPAEEIGRGKQPMIDAGVFAGTEAALMFHPFPGPEGKASLSTGSLAISLFDITYHGKTAHAAVAPWNGVNALDAVVQLFVGIGLLRQQLQPDTRLHGIITNGGQAFNVIPHLTAARVGVRSPDGTYLREVVTRLRDIAEAAARASGTRVEIEPVMFMDSIRPNATLTDVVSRNLGALGLAVQPPRPTPASTDFGNLSQILPAVSFGIPTHPPEAGLHTPLAHAVGTTDRAHEGMIVAAKAIALSIADLARDATLRARARQEIDNG
ncbi:MAG: M20 family peptidase [Chloroflexota bacterium]|nr:MAG: M20 family peptidase [Chloroflexota bacterium]